MKHHKRSINIKKPILHLLGGTLMFGLFACKKTNTENMPKLTYYQSSSSGGMSGGGYTIRN